MKNIFVVRMIFVMGMFSVTQILLVNIIHGVG